MSSLHWLSNPFTGVFTRFGPPETRAQDPAVPLWAGSLAACGPRAQSVEVGGAGWTDQDAHDACVGEAIERFQTYVLPLDATVESSFESWGDVELALAPEAWVLFHPDQYAVRGFPFRPFDAKTVCRWVAFRDAGSGTAVWIPEEMGFLFAAVRGSHRLSPSISTGLSCGRWGDPVLLRGLQEVIERDAIMGAWWDRYALEEWTAAHVFERVGEETARRCQRANLTYRFYRVDSPLSAHALIVTAEGMDREGFLFSAGAACRETRREAWRKALLEAVQGWHYVRYLKSEVQRSHAKTGRASRPSQEPRDFADHALYFSLNPERLDRTALRRARPVPPSEGEGAPEDLDALRRRIGEDRPVLFRNVTPPSIAAEAPEWYVLKVVVPGLQPMHGHHGFPHLGGPLWAPRGTAEWAHVEPHPFP